MGGFQYWGVTGEQDLGFWLGPRGYAIVYGPGGAGGKSAFAPGIDALAAPVDPAVRLPLLIIDNKSAGLPNEIKECPAFTDRPADKIKELLATVTAGPDFPGKPAALGTLGDLVETITSGGGHVPGVKFALSNAGGFARQPSSGLQQRFQAATRLTDAAGRPETLDFIDTVTPSELAARQAQVAATRSKYNPTGNPRGAGANSSVLVTEPVLLDPMRSVVERQEAIAGSMGGAMLGALEIVKLAFSVVSPYLPTVAERELAKATPRILEQLRANPGSGALLVGCYWLPEQPGPVDGTQFQRWNWQLGPSADEAYGRWAVPRMENGRAGYLKQELYYWFDGRTTTSYRPGP